MTLTVGELTASLARYESHLPVEVFTAEGVYQHIIEVDDSDGDTPDIRPTTVYLSCATP